MYDLLYFTRFSPMKVESKEKWWWFSPWLATLRRTRRMRALKKPFVALGIMSEVSTTAFWHQTFTSRTNLSIAFTVSSAELFTTLYNVIVNIILLTYLFFYGCAISLLPILWHTYLLSILPFGEVVAAATTINDLILAAFGLRHLADIWHNGGGATAAYANPTHVGLRALAARYMRVAFRVWFRGIWLLIRFNFIVLHISTYML